MAKTALCTMRFNLTIILLLAGLAALAQPTIQTSGDWINLSNTATRVQQAQGLAGFDMHRKQVLGSPYEDSTFQAGTIRFYKKLPGTTVDSLIGVPVRYDLQLNQVEIKAAPTDIRVATAAQVRQFAMNNKALKGISYYVNVREFSGEANQLQGFFELVTPGKALLLRYPSVSVSKANYNLAMNVGSKDDELVIKQVWYVAMNRQAVPFSPSKKALLALFSDKEAQLTTFLKNQKPDLKTRSGLASVFAFYNDL
ncbi:hypothetical protein [Fibrivirga algicola]|uniref:Uncharacterized protein n=1 Tax=Fibrivirga algicola TaxID=2950420 RepID=A0ABX0QNC9_9BACT|nr:hypothetical protein [Fibrivirga algicola]NID13283.1 hypothetical protein [Fibrivirga algicola]